MKKRKIGFFVIAVSFSIIGLLWMQYHLISFSFELKSNDFDNKVTEVLLETGEEVEKSFYCIDFFSEFDVTTKDAIYLIKHRVAENGLTTINEDYSPDTININYWNPFLKDSILKYSEVYFSFPAKIRMEMNVEYIENGNDNINNERLTINSYRKSLDENKNFIITLDSIMKKSLLSRGITDDYEYLLKSEQSDTIFYMQPNNANAQKIQNSLPTILFADNYFFKPISLYIYFPNKKINLFKELWMMILGSIILLSILTIMISYLIRTIFQQRKLRIIQSDFISNMTHEFKTPVANINLALDTLEKQTEISDEQISVINGIIREENQRLQQNIELILETSILEKKSIPIRISDVCINELLTHAADSISFEMDEKDGEIELNFSTENITIKADETHLSHVIYNLLDNAIKYTTKKPKIKISSQIKGDHIVIGISDNGIGIKTADQEKIFDKFFRVSKGNQHDIKGFGLGLFYAKQVIKNLNGEIIVKSKLDKGTLFELWLPK